MSHACGILTVVWDTTHLQIAQLSCHRLTTLPNGNSIQLSGVHLHRRTVYKQDHLPCHPHALQSLPHLLTVRLCPTVLPTLLVEIPVIAALQAVQQQPSAKPG